VLVPIGSGLMILQTLARTISCTLRLISGEKDLTACGRFHKT
jgi:hypothetical protein